jgi:predicted nucleotide-binding protein
VPVDDIILSGVGREAIRAVCEQLADDNLIHWEPLTGPNEGHIIGNAKIRSRGVDVVTGDRVSPIEIRFPNAARPDLAAATPAIKEPERINLADGLKLLEEHLPAEEAKARLRQAFVQKAFSQAPLFALAYDEAVIDWTTGLVKIPRKNDRFCPTFLRTDFASYFLEGCMTGEISQEGRKARFEMWEKLGVDRVKADLINGGHQLIGGPPQVTELAWEWVRLKESEVAPAVPTYTHEAARAVYAAIDDLVAARKRAYSLSVPIEAETILLASGHGRSTSEAHTQIRAAIVGLAAAGKIEVHVEPYKDWLIREPLEPEVEDMAAQIPKIFVVHGHDNEAKTEVARFIERLGFQPLILYEQASKGRTIIEKFEANSDVGFAVVLLTPDDEGSKKGQPAKPRARQNVVLELGYFVGRLGRDRVCALRRGEVEIPSDFDGVVYETYDEHGAWKGKLAKELEAAKFVIDWAKVHA